MRKPQEITYIEFKYMPTSVM